MNDLLLVGVGPMAQAYSAVLQDQGAAFQTVGRSQATVDAFTGTTGLQAASGGVEAWLQAHGPPRQAIVATGAEALEAAALELLRAGTKRLLIEKPMALTTLGARRIVQSARTAVAEVAVGYNRRFYASTRAAAAAIKEDGGPLSAHIEFTEWTHVIEKLEKAPGVKEQWFLGNSTHVLDLAFHLCGTPSVTTGFTTGFLPWHPAGAIFGGSAQTAAGMMYTYHANWLAPGRWGVDIMTRHRRFVFRPLEQLQVQKHGSVAIEPVLLEDSLDKKFKPGLWRQVHAFLSGTDSSDLCTAAQQLHHMEGVFSDILRPKAPMDTARAAVQS